MSATAISMSSKTLPEDDSIEISPSVRHDHEEVAVRAYQFWLERGCPDGSPEVDWFRAEAELNHQPKDFDSESPAGEVSATDVVAGFVLS